MVNKKLLMVCFAAIAIIFNLGCYRQIYVYIPPKGTIFGCPLYDSIGCIPINQKDTIMINERSETHIYKVIEIKKQNGVYRVKMESDSLVHSRYRRDSLWYDDNYYPVFEVFSIETEKIKNSQKIKKGNKYELTLNPYFMHDVLVDFSVREVYINGIPFGISTGNTNIYTTQNLNGLYYIPFQKNK